MPRSAGPIAIRWLPGIALSLALAASTSAGRAAAADTYHVSARGPGSDRHPGTARRPWRTLQHAADRAGPGDTVIVLPGTYAGFNAVRSGSAGRPITFSGRYGARITTAAAGAHRSRINLDGVSYVVIEGFEVVGTSDQADSKEGIRVVGPPGGSAGHVTIRRNHVHHNGDRNILTGFVSHLVIEHNVVHHAAQEHGIYVSNSADHHVIRGNVVHSNAASGIQINGDASLGGDGVVSDALVEGNLLWDNGGGAMVDLGRGPERSRGGGSAINLDGVQRSVVRGNVLLGNHAAGISLYRIDGGAPSGDLLVVDNLVVNGSGGGWALKIQDEAGPIAVRRNILTSRGPAGGGLRIDGASLPGLRADDNVYDGRFQVDDAAVDPAGWLRRAPRCDGRSGVFPIGRPTTRPGGSP